jgi:drug/metabolite transporter (DMT)-like permease
VWGLLLGLERPTLKGTSGVGLSVLGVGIVFHEGLVAEGAGLVGDLSVLLAAMGFGAYTVLSMRMLKRYSPLMVATYPTLFGAPVLLALSVPLFTEMAWEDVGAGTWAAVAFSAVFATAFAFSAWQKGVSRIGANRALVYQYLITVTGIGSGVVFFGEALGASKIAGGAVILTGVYLARKQ